MTTSSDQRQRDRQSLKDLAKLATSSNAQLPSTNDLSADDSGMVDLKTVARLSGMLGGDVAKPVAPFAPPPSSGSLAFVRTESVPPAPATQPLVATPAPASVQNFAQSIVANAPPVNHTPTLISQQSPAQHAAIAYAATVPQAAYVAPIAPAAPIAAPIAIEQETITVDASEVEEIRSSKKGVVIVLASLVAAAALAAGGALVVNKIHRAPVAVAQKAPVVETTPVVNAVKAPVVETAPIAAAAAPEPPAAEDLTFAPADPNPALDLSSLPVANAKGAKTAPAKVAAKPAKAEIAKAAEPKPEPKIEAKPAEPPPAPEPPKVAKASGKGDSLTDAMRTAAGPIETSKAAVVESGPAFAAGSVPQKPSQGALTSALGAVLPSARSCLSPDDAVAKATIVFNSVGKVDSVSVHGGPAGKGECIKTALLKAKIQPFMDPTYTANITVRP